MTDTQPPDLLGLTSPDKDQDGDPLSAIFLALADPTRRAMIAALSEREQTLTELAAPFQISLPAVKKHLAILQRAGLIHRSQVAQRKPCALNAQPLRSATGWINQYRAMWEARLDRLDAFVIAMQVVDDAQRGAKESAAADKPPSPDPGATDDPKPPAR